MLSAEQLVACPTSTPLLAAYVLAGDRGDSVTSSVAITVDGGGGDDRLAGSPSRMRSTSARVATWCEEIGATTRSAMGGCPAS
jgi:hypothetical protein